VKLPTTSTLLSSLSTNNSSLLTTETSLSRKRKAEPLESTITAPLSTQKTLKKPVVPTTTTTTTIIVPVSDNDERKYNTENIQPIPTESIRLGVDLHCYIPAPKRPRIDPFSSIYAKLESQNTSDDDFNIGIKAIKVR
jgi:hypothetical protein